VISDSFIVGSGVRQGGCLSPAIFNVFINMLIQKLRKLNTGCHVSGMFLGCLLYADDIILISPSVNGLQEMLDKCFDISQLLSLQFNARKCHCLTVGKLSKVKISRMLLGGNDI